MQLTNKVIRNNADLLLVLKLIEVNHRCPKKRKKLLIRLARKTRNLINQSVNHILNARDFSKELDNLIQGANDLSFVIRQHREHGSQGFAVVGDEYFPVVIDIRSKEDKEHALENEGAIVDTVRTNLSRHPSAPGKRGTVIMFEEDGFSGVPFRFIVPNPSQTIGG